MRSGWIKHFSDGQSETGFDGDVLSHKSSWRNGRLDGLVAVDLRHGGITVSLSAGNGNWWQSDTLVSKFQGYGKVGVNEYILRRLEFQIEAKHVGLFLSKIERDEKTIIYRLSDAPTDDSYIEIPTQLVGKWLHVVLNAKTGMVSVNFYDDKK